MARAILAAVIAVAVFTAVKNKRGEPLPPVLTNIQKCIALYKTSMDPNMPNDPEIVTVMINEGFKTFDDLLLDRCERWDRKGQEF